MANLLDPHPPTLAVDIPADVCLRADLHIPASPAALVLFAHGSGSSRLSPRNQVVARELQSAGFATLLLDLLTSSEEVLDQRTAHLRFDIDLLAKRLLYAVQWIRRHPDLGSLRLGCFGASTGAAAALLAASEGRPFAAIVSRGGRPDLAAAALEKVHAPVLLIVGSHDPEVLDLNRQAKARLNVRTRLAVVPGATHLFEEPGTLAQVARLAQLWFERWLLARAPSRRVA
ncbi:MAG TPA: dienelactone hydrolase family protein [Acidobacteriaceae bacterium]|jgi:dienelactone hydrolase|nr:dienelactone hydrolase family protein [Acidobacteriaceae bacterium]